MSSKIKIQSAFHSNKRYEPTTQLGNSDTYFKVYFSFRIDLSIHKTVNRWKKLFDISEI